MPSPMQIQSSLTEMLHIKYPIIMAPMFLVTNDTMVIEASKAGIAGCIPALNYRSIEELEAGIMNMKKHKGPEGAIGINLIVNKSNIHYKKQLESICKLGVDFVITSLGSPKETIDRCRPQGIKVFCDVVDESYALKVQELGADALIAVNSGAGGHLGKIPASVLIPTLKQKCDIPVISAGGVGTGAGILSMLALGADGLSIGSPFIACKEASINQDYKKACIDYGAKDITVTTKLSGTPCTVIETPYVKKIGVEQNPLEKFLNSNKKLKKYSKMLTYYKGMKLLEKAAFAATYKSVWCAGSSIEFTQQEKSIQELVVQYVEQLQMAKENLDAKLNSHS